MAFGFGQLRRTPRMSDELKLIADELCSGCVYCPPNLPRSAYSEADWAMLQARTCSFEHTQGTDDCLASRKTSCSLVDLTATQRRISASYKAP